MNVGTYAAWVQAIATPIGIFVALVAAFYAPWWMRRQEEKRTKLLAVNRAAQAAGAISTLRTLADDPEVIGGNNPSELPIQEIRHALARLEAFPRDSLSKPHIDTALTLLELHLQAALEVAPIVLEKLQSGPLSREEIASLDHSSARAKELLGDVCRAAGVDPRKVT